MKVPKGWNAVTNPRHFTLTDLPRLPKNYPDPLKTPEGEFVLV